MLLIDPLSNPFSNYRHGRCENFHERDRKDFLRSRQGDRHTSRSTILVRCQTYLRTPSCWAVGERLSAWFSRCGRWTIPLQMEGRSMAFWFQLCRRNAIGLRLVTCIRILWEACAFPFGEELAKLYGIIPRRFLDGRIGTDCFESTRIGAHDRLVLAWVNSVLPSQKRRVIPTLVWGPSALSRSVLLPGLPMVKEPGLTRINSSPMSGIIIDRLFESRP